MASLERDDDPLIASPFSVDWHDVDGVRIVTLIGEVDLSCSEELEAALTADRLLVDMAQVTFMDSTGIRCLLNAKDRSTDLAVVSNPRVDRILEITGLLEYFTGRTKRLQ